MSPKRRLEDGGGGGSGGGEDGGEGGSRSAPPKRRRRLGGRPLKRSRSFDLTLQELATSYLQMMEMTMEAETAIITRALVEECSSKDANECMSYNQPDYEMKKFRIATPAPKSTEATDKIIHEASNDTEFSGGPSQKCTFKMLGSDSEEATRPLLARAHESSNVVVAENESNRHYFDLIFRKLESIEEQIQVVLAKKENSAPGKLESKERIQTVTQREGEIICSGHYDCNNELLVQDVKQKPTSAKAVGFFIDGRKGKSTNVRLHFLSAINNRVYHDVEIKSESNEAIRIGIFDGGTRIISGPLSKVKIEILALEGNFPYDVQSSWSAKDFSDHIARGRDEKGNVLVGEGTIAQLIDGELDLGSIKFREGSCKARKGMFIIGARVCQSDKPTDVRVHEAIMKPVVVQDRRNKFNGKNYPPKLDDRVYRLEEIAKNGRYCKRLEMENIHNVQDFLRALNKNPDNLTKILQINKEHKTWEKMVSHARQCYLEGKKHELTSYHCLKENVVLFFDCVYGLMGAAFVDGCYTPCNKFDPGQQLLVDKLKRRAYDHLDHLCPDYVMTDKFPVPIYDTNAGSGAVPSYISNSTQRKVSGDLAGLQEVKVLSHDQIQSSGVNNANNDPGSSSAPPDHQSTHEYPGLVGGQGSRPADQEISSDSLTDLLQDPLGHLNSRNWETEELPLGYKDDALAHLLDQIDTINCVEPRLGQEEIQGEFFWQGNETFQASTSHSNMISSTPQQPTTSGVLGSAHGALGQSSSSTQVSLQPRQWSQWQGDMP